MLNLQTATREELLAHLAELESKRPSGGIKTTEKGGVSVYGLGRFPVTLYASQWQALNERMPEIMAHVTEGLAAGKLAVKEPKAK